MIKRFILIFSSLILPHLTFAGLDPIGWSVNHTFPNPVIVGTSTYNSTYTFKNQLPFQLVIPLIIEKTANSPDFTYNDTCSGVRLTPNQTCTVTIFLDPTTEGKKQVQLIIAGYSKDRVPVPQQSVIATGHTGINIQVSLTPPLPSVMNVGSTSQYEFTYTNSGTTAATGVSLTSNYVNYSTTCTSTLQPGDFCTAGGMYTMTDTSSLTVTSNFAFAEGSTIVSSTTTSRNQATGITGKLTPGLSTTTIVGQPSTVQFTFTNNDAAAVTVTQNNTFPVEFVVLPGDNQCPNPGAFAGHSSCTITGTFTPAAAGSYTITSELTYTPDPGQTTLTTTTTSQVAGAGDRIFTFKNSCNFDVWFSLNGGAITNSPSCPSTPCPAGSTCNPTTNLCYWNNYSPSVGSFQLTASSGQATVIIPVTTNDINGNMWSGNTSASTVCDGISSCLQADCQNNGGTTSCAVGVGFNQPATQAEFTLGANKTDSYDVEVINGFHIPIKMSPNAVVPNGYSCGSPGQLAASPDFSACNWSTSTPPTPTSSYYWVSTTTSGGTCPNSCGPDDVCGLDINIDQHCGKFLGYWAGNEACSINNTKANSYFACNTGLAIPPFPSGSNYQVTQLYQCKPPTASSLFNSCYNFPSAGNIDCCGCIDWNSIPGITLPSSTISCSGTSDDQWTQYIEPTIEWMKKTCSSYYVYPFDDKSSSFTCSNTTPPAINSTNYTIEFCPSGNTGLPAGLPLAADGR